MNPLSAAETGLALPADVRAFAAAQGLEQLLAPLPEMTKCIFPSARRLEGTLEEDPEIAGLRFIVFEVEVAGLDVPGAVSARRQWLREVLRYCPPPGACAFVLGLELVK